MGRKQRRAWAEEDGAASEEGGVIGVGQVWGAVGPDDVINMIIKLISS